MNETQFDLLSDEEQDELFMQYALAEPSHLVCLLCWQNKEFTPLWSHSPFWNWLAANK